MTFTANAFFDESAELKAALGDAAGKLWRADIRTGLQSGALRAMVVAAATAAVIAAEIVVARLAGSLGGIAVWTAGLGVLALCVTAALSMTGRRRRDWAEVAERLDLAADSRNAIATALDLCQAGDGSPLARRAVADGLAAARALAAVEPAVPAVVSRGRRGPAYLICGLAAVGLALLTPRFPQAGMRPALPEATVAMLRPTAPSAEIREVAVTPPARKVLADASSLSALSPGLASPSERKTGTSDNASASASAASSGESSAVRANAGESGGSSPPPSQSTSAGQPQAAGAKRSGSADKTMATESLSFGSSSPDALASQGAPESGSAGAANPSASSAGKNDNAGNGQPKNDGGDKKSDDSRASGDNGQSAGAGQSTQSRGTSNGNSMQSGNQAGGKGQSSGQNPPKKSRGVAPLMLGIRQADLVQGRQLPGPDERTKLQIPPRPTPESPQPAAPTDVRQNGESAVDIYNVPAAAQQAVQQYFEQLHQDPDAAASR